jgi:hypothetical protein
MSLQVGTLVHKWMEKDPGNRHALVHPVCRDGMWTFRAVLGTERPKVSVEAIDPDAATALYRAEAQWLEELQNIKAVKQTLHKES